MCVAAPVLIAAASAVSAVGQLSAGNENKAIADENAHRLDAGAIDAILRGRSDAAALRTQVAARVGQQRAGLSAANVDISRGSAAQLSADTAAAGENEVMRTLNNAAREAYGMHLQAFDTRVQGQTARDASRLGAFSTLLTAGSNVYGMRKRP